LLKLSTLQYRNTVLELARRYELPSDVEEDLADALSVVPDDSLSAGFRGLDDRLSLEHVQGFFNVALKFGDELAQNEEVLERIAGACALDETLSDECWNDFIDGFLKVAQRRPLSVAERERMTSLRQSFETPGEQVRGAVVVAFSSPRFLYHVEIDGPETRAPLVFQLDAYERAARLSYTFWQTMPDRELFEAADDGSLLEPEVYQAQLRRVFLDEKTRSTFKQFWNEWLGLEKFTGFETSRPAFQALTEGESFGEPGHEHYRDMVDEVYDLTELFTFEQPGTVRELLETDLSVTRSTDLASLYGVEPWDGSSAYPRFPAGERAGLLHRGALLVSNLEQTNPFHRGALVRRRFLCGDLPQPDPNALPPGSLDPPALDQSLTTRERFQNKVDGGVCGECHDSFSTIGYVLESFDAVGRFRSEEQIFDEESGALLGSLAIDASGVASIVDANEAAVDGPIELNRAIVESGKVEPCLGRNYFEFVMRRVAEKGSLDACAIEDLAKLLGSDDAGLGQAFESIGESPTFTSRRMGSP